MSINQSKVLYGLKQAPKSWYETTQNFLTECNFKVDKINIILFIKKIDSDIMLVRIYGDDIIFESTNEKHYQDFSKLMYDEYEMSLMRELTVRNIEL